MNSSNLNEYFYVKSIKYMLYSYDDFDDINIIEMEFSSEASSQVRPQPATSPLTTSLNINRLTDIAIFYSQRNLVSLQSLTVNQVQALPHLRIALCSRCAR